MILYFSFLFSVCLCARFQSDPRESHLAVVKRIFRYLKGTTNLGLLYRKSLDYKLIGFSDADYAGDKIERKSTSGNCQFLGDNLYPGPAKDKKLLPCLQQKQNTSQLHVVVHNYFGLNISWKITRFMLTVFPSIVIILLLFVCQPILHSRAKHIEIKHHFIRDYVQKGILDIQFIDTEH